MARPAKGNSIKILEGEYDKSRIKTTPQAIGLPVRPKGLKPQARKLWDYITPKLHEIGTATEIDTPALTALVQWWATYLEAQKAVDKIEDWTTTEAQRVLTATSKAYENFRRLSLEFGLTPKARNQIDVKPQEKDDLEKFFA